MKRTAIEEKEILRYFKLYDFSNEFRNKTILITGAGGMIGKGIVMWLLFLNMEKNTNISIIASTRYPERKFDYIEDSDRIEFCKFGHEREYTVDRQIDYIVHGSAPTGREYFINNPVETIRTIIDSTERLLEVAKNHPGSRFLFISSMDIYGVVNESKPVTEDYVGIIDPAIIRNGYPLGKSCGEYLCHAYCDEYGVDAMIIRPASVQGLFQKYDEPRVINELLRCIVEKKDLILQSDGSGKKCFLYTLDVITAILTILSNGEKGSVYNATNRDSFITLKELGQKIFSNMGLENKVICNMNQQKNLGYLPPLSFVQDTTKLEEKGWKCHTSIEDIYRIDVIRFTKGK